MQSSVGSLDMRVDVVGTISVYQRFPVRIPTKSKPLMNANGR